MNLRTPSPFSRTRPLRELPPKRRRGHTGPVAGVAASLAALLLAAPASGAESWLGTGRSGALTVTTPGAVVNRSTPLLSPARAGEATLDVGPDVLFAGDLVLVLQVQESAPPGADAGAPITETAVGRFELARVAEASALGVRLESPLTQSFLEGTQVVFVPEYTSVTVTDGGSITANP